VIRRLLKGLSSIGKKNIDLGGVEIGVGKGVSPTLVHCNDDYHIMSTIISKCRELIEDLTDEIAEMESKTSLTLEEDVRLKDLKARLNSLNSKPLNRSSLLIYPSKRKPQK